MAGRAQLRADLQRLREAISSGDYESIRTLDPRLQMMAIRSIAVTKEDCGMLPYLQPQAMLESTLYGMALKTKNRCLLGFIESETLRNAGYSKIDDGTARQDNATVLRVRTAPVGGEILVDAKKVGEGFYAAEVTPGKHTVSFGAVCHPELADGEFTPPGPQSVEIADRKEVTITGQYQAGAK